MIVSAAHVPASMTQSGKLISVEPLRSAVVAGASVHLLTHFMPSVTGGMTPATTVLAVPHGAVPHGGWPVVAWAHGTSTGGQKLRAPSLSPTLDGGLTADGSVTGYVWVFESLIAAGYAIAAPDLEGLGAAAENPHPYFSTSSLARSLISSVLAARYADRNLSNRWVSIGHSEGGHGALAVNAYATEALGIEFLGSVAFAPFTSVNSIVKWHGERMINDPVEALASAVQQNFNVALVAAGIRAQNPVFDFHTVMGDDLTGLMPSTVEKGSVDIVADISNAIERRGVSFFTGFKADWHLADEACAFLAANDLAIIPGFTMNEPTLVLQGGRDVSVPDSVTKEFVDRVAAESAPVVFSRYATADHFTIVQQGLSEALAFLSSMFKR